MGEKDIQGKRRVNDEGEALWQIEVQCSLG